MSAAPSDRTPTPPPALRPFPTHLDGVGSADDPRPGLAYCNGCGWPGNPTLVWEQDCFRCRVRRRRAAPASEIPEAVKLALACFAGACFAFLALLILLAFLRW